MQCLPSIAFVLKCMDIQPKLGGVVKKLFNFGNKIFIFRDNGLKFCRLIKCNPTNDTMMESFKIHLKFILFFTTPPSLG